MSVAIPASLILLRRNHKGVSDVMSYADDAQVQAETAVTDSQHVQTSDPVPSSEGPHSNMSFFFLGYKRTRYWWEGVVMLRKVLVISFPLVI